MDLGQPLGRLQDCGLPQCSYFVPCRKVAFARCRLHWTKWTIWVSLCAMRWYFTLGLIALGAAAQPVSAHPGGLNARGCHHNRKTGDYHCHRRRSDTPPPAPPQRFSGSGGDRYFPNCAAARAAGAAPMRRDEPGYRSGLDRDNDGIACE